MSLHDDRHYFIPLAWKHWVEDAWYLQEAVSKAKTMEHPTDIYNLMADTVVSIASLCKKAGVCTDGGFQRLKWRQSVEFILKHKSNVVYDKRGPHGWGRLAEHGFLGKQLPHSETHWQNIHNEYDVVEILKNIMLLKRVA